MSDKAAQRAEAKRNEGTEMRADGIYKDGKKVRGGNFKPAQIEKHNAKWAPKKKAAPKPEPVEEVVEEAVQEESAPEKKTTNKKAKKKGLFNF